MVIEWTHQIQEVLKSDSSQPLLEGLNPGPFVEIEFWKNKASNLECIYEQVKKIFNLFPHNPEFYPYKTFWNY